jgi:hypothetical protein
VSVLTHDELTQMFMHVIAACMHEIVTGSKAIGSVITNAFSDSLTHLVHYGGMIALCVSALSLYTARYLGLKFDEYIETGYIVGDNDTDAATQQQQHNGNGFALVDTELGAVQDSDNDNDDSDNDSSSSIDTNVHKVDSPDYTELDTDHKHSERSGSVSKDAVESSSSNSNDAGNTGVQLRELQSGSSSSDVHKATAVIADTANV